MVVKNEKLKKNKKIYYLGSVNLAQKSAHSEGYLTTLESAIKMAVDRAQESEQDQIVVQIVRRIRVMKPPIKIEVV